MEKAEIKQIADYLEDLEEGLYELVFNKEQWRLWAGNEFLDLLRVCAREGKRLVKVGILLTTSRS